MLKARFRRAEDGSELPRKNAVLKIFVIFFSCSFPILINTMDGVRSVEPTLVDTARIFGRSRYEIIRQVILPASLHQIFTGWRVALPIALIVDIVSEMVGALNGIGRFILVMQRSFNIPEMYAGAVTVGTPATVTFDALPGDTLKGERRLRRLDCFRGKPYPAGRDYPSQSLPEPESGNGRQS